MKMYLLSDNIDTQIGMRLAGIESKLIKSEQELNDAFAELMDNPDIAVILITEKLNDLYADCINSVKLAHDKPLIVEIPDRHGSRRANDSITSYVTDAIGLKL